MRHLNSRENALAVSRQPFLAAPFRLTDFASIFGRARSSCANLSRLANQLLQLEMVEGRTSIAHAKVHAVGG